MGLRSPLLPETRVLKVVVTPHGRIPTLRRQGPHGRVRVVAPALPLDPKEPRVVQTPRLARGAQGPGGATTRTVAEGVRAPPSLAPLGVRTPTIATATRTATRVGVAAEGVAIGVGLPVLSGLPLLPGLPGLRVLPGLPELPRPAHEFATQPTVTAHP